MYIIYCKSRKLDGSSKEYIESYNINIKYNKNGNMITNFKLNKKNKAKQFNTQIEANNILNFLKKINPKRELKVITYEKR